MCYPKKSCKLSSSDSRAQSYTMDCKNNAVIPGCTTSAPSSNRNFCYKPSQCTEKSVVQKGHSWLDFPLYRNKEQGNWARVNPGQYVPAPYVRARLPVLPRLHRAPVPLTMSSPVVSVGAVAVAQ